MKLRTLDRLRQYLSVAALLWAAACFYVVHTDHPRDYRGAIIIITWAVLPPLWLWAEEVLFYRTTPRGNYKRFRDGQAAAQRFWAAIGAALAGLYAIAPK